MKIASLQRAVIEGLVHVKTDEERTELLSALNELNELQQLYEKNDERNTWHDEIYFITAQDTIDLINRNLYNTYGDLYCADDNSEVDREKFIAAIRNDYNLCSFGFEHFTDAMLDAGWQVISDLYVENEYEGSNDEYGHYKK